MVNYMLGELIYFRKLLISITTGHLTQDDVITRVKNNSSINIYLDDLQKNDPNIKILLEKIENKINDLCEHDVVVDWIDDVIGDDVIKIKYCRICELNMYKFTHGHCYSCQ